MNLIKKISDHKPLEIKGGSSKDNNMTFQDMIKS